MFGPGPNDPLGGAGGVGVLPHLLGPHGSFGLGPNKYGFTRFWCILAIKSWILLDFGAFWYIWPSVVQCPDTWGRTPHTPLP